MASDNDEGMILVTGANGHVGSELCRILRAAESNVLPVDLDANRAHAVVACDLRLKSDVSRLFQAHRICAVIHLAGILPTAFRSDPLSGVDVNLNGSFELIRQAIDAHVRRFIFASSTSVYGSVPRANAVTEDDPALPDEPYGASKRVVELVGENLASSRAIEFVSLRVARVVGLGIRKTSSPWRSQIFEQNFLVDAIRIPHAPSSMLSLVHVQDVARMLVVLLETADVRRVVYNTPTEVWQAAELKETIERLRGIRVELADTGDHGGPVCDGSRFKRDFGFQLRSIRDRLLDCAANC